MNEGSEDILLKCMLCRSHIMLANLVDITNIEAVIFDSMLLKAFHYHNSI